MADIHDLPISSIRKFLSANGIYNYQGFLSDQKSNKDLYKIAFDLMKTKNAKYEDVPINIIEWILAYNALQKNLNIKNYTKGQIKNLPQNDLDDLANLLGLTKNNRDNVINVLSFMHKIKFSDLDFESYEDLYVSLLTNSEFSTIIKLIQSKPSLKKSLPSLFYEILINNKNLVKNRDKNLYYRETSDFIRSLINLKEFDIIEKILPIISNNDKNNYYNLIELFAETRFLDKYFKFFPTEFDRAFFVSVVKALNNKKVKHYYLISKILETAIHDKNYEMMKYLIPKIKIDLAGVHKIIFYGAPLLLEQKEEDMLIRVINKAIKEFNKSVNADFEDELDIIDNEDEEDAEDDFEDDHDEYDDYDYDGY
jgi:hypothetical protein